MEDLKRELQEVMTLYQEVMDEVKTDENLAIVFEQILITVSSRIQQLREEITAIETASCYLPKDYLNKKEIFGLSSVDPATNILDLLLGMVKSKINELSTALVDNGPQISKEELKIIIRRKFSNIKNDIVDSIQDAAVHYYTGNGSTVKLGAQTIDRIKKSEDVQRYCAKIEEGFMSSPASGSSLPIDLQREDTNLTCYLGSMTMRYETICDADSCTTIYIVDSNGFVDPNKWSDASNDDGGGSDDKLEGIPYNHDSVTWSEDFPNPGYPVKDARPLPIEK
ncbi:MAG: hypothetical protein AB8E82_09350 [Aureispira sp.]